MEISPEITEMMNILGKKHRAYLKNISNIIVKHGECSRKTGGSAQKS
jgi:hypothetical protein